jgi:hypothetical protein
MLKSLIGLAGGCTRLTWPVRRLSPAAVRTSLSIQFEAFPDAIGGLLDKQHHLSAP